MRYYIDESGNGGDLYFLKNNFNNQPFFSLSAIGLKVDIISEFEKCFITLKKKYKIQANELKLKNIYPKKISFLEECIDFLLDNNSNILVETVDKKYQIALSIVDSLVYPPYFTEQNFENNQAKLIIATYLYDSLPMEYLKQFLQISRDNSSEKNLLSLFNNLIKILHKIDDKMSSSVVKHIKESIDDYYQLKKDKNLPRPDYTYFLPLPDKNKRGEIVVLLPHINYFTNLEARINFIYNQKVNKIKIFHDEQHHFDEIIKSYNSLSNNHIELLNVDKINPYSLSNFDFKDKIVLEFITSNRNSRIQIADLIAGFTNKVINNIYSSNIDKNEIKLLLKIKELHLKNREGINLVAAIDKQEKVFCIIESLNV